jgi:hypothetical protein
MPWWAEPTLRLTRHVRNLLRAVVAVGDRPGVHRRLGAGDRAPCAIQAGGLGRAEAEFCRLFCQPHGLRVPVPVRAADERGRLLAARVFHCQPGKPRSAQQIHPGNPADLRAGDHDEHLGRRAAAGDGRAAPDAAGGGFRHRNRQVFGGGVDLHGVAAILAVRDLLGADFAGQRSSRRQGRYRHGIVLRHVLGLLADGPGDAGDRHGGFVPDAEPDGQLHLGDAVQRDSRDDLLCRRAGSRQLHRAADFAVELRRSVRRLRPRRDQPGLGRVLRADRGAGHLPEYGLDRQAALAAARRNARRWPGW